jgi:hypothetical protein
MVGRPDKVVQQRATAAPTDSSDGVSEVRGPGGGNAGADSAWQRCMHASLAVWCIRAAAVLGVALRVRNWAHDASLWLDEISVSNNILARGFGELTKPLAGEQAAPIGWLWSVHAAADLFGHSELALRFVPMLSSVIALVAVAALSRMVLGDIGAAITALLFATSPYMILYAAQLKQYSTDTAAVALLLLVSVWTARQQPTTRDLAVWTATCAVLVWFSFPAGPVALLCGAVLAVRWLRSWDSLARFAAAGAVVGGSVLCEYFLTLRHLAADKVLYGYWQQIGGYPPSDGSKVSWLRHVVPAVIRNPVGINWPVLALALGGLGVLAVARDRPTVAAILLAPMVSGLALALTNHYPLYQRLAVYLAPSALLLVSAGAIGAGRLVNEFVADRWEMWAAAGLASVLLVIATAHGVVSGLDKFGGPDEITAGREAMAYIGSHEQAGDVVLYESVWAGEDMRHYGRRYGVSPAGFFGVGDCDGDYVTPLRGQARVWLYFSHRASTEPPDRAEVFLSHFAQQGTALASWSGPGHAGAYLFDFSTRPADPPPPKPLWKPGMCVWAIFHS